MGPGQFEYGRDDCAGRSIADLGTARAGWPPTRTRTSVGRRADRRSRRTTRPRLGGVSGGLMSSYEIRRATPGDAQGLADAHRDSIQSLGPASYPPQSVEDWQEAIGSDLYLNAMNA